jgi:predicted nucleic acid-binding protein
MLQSAHHVLPARTVDVIQEDPDDNRILECALAARSDFIVTADKDLLRLQRYEGIEILTSTAFLQRTASQPI